MEAAKLHGSDFKGRIELEKRNEAKSVRALTDLVELCKETANDKDYRGFLIFGAFDIGIFKVT
jgi:hypothetical protein